MKNEVFQVAKATLAAVIFSLVFVLVFTFIVKVFLIPTTAVKITNQICKTLCIAAGGVLFLRGEHGLIKGAIFGAVASILAWLLFGAIGGALIFSWKLLAELALGAIAGAISGIIAVNFKNRQ